LIEWDVGKNSEPVFCRRVALSEGMNASYTMFHDELNVSYKRTDVNMMALYDKQIHVELCGMENFQINPLPTFYME
jgi:hypothetical protein